MTLKDNDELRELLSRLRTDLYNELATDKFYAEKAAKLLDDYELEFERLISTHVMRARIDELGELNFRIAIKGIQKDPPAIFLDIAERLGKLNTEIAHLQSQEEEKD